LDLLEELGIGSVQDQALPVLELLRALLDELLNSLLVLSSIAQLALFLNRGYKGVTGNSIVPGI